MAEPPVHVSTDEVVAEPRRTGHGWFDLAVAVSAIVISVASLVIAVQNSRTQRQMVAASSWPFVQAQVDDHFKGSAVIGLVNSGIGPAKIAWYEVFYKGQPVDTSVALLRLCCGLSDDPGFRHRQIPHGYGYGNPNNVVLRAGETQTILEIRSAEQAPELHDRFVREMGSLRFRACYCSVFDECWLSDLVDLTPTRMAACPAAAHPFGFGVDPG